MYMISKSDEKLSKTQLLTIVNNFINNSKTLTIKELYAFINYMNKKELQKKHDLIISTQDHISKVLNEIRAFSENLVYKNVVLICLSFNKELTETDVFAIYDEFDFMKAYLIETNGDDFLLGQINHSIKLLKKHHPVAKNTALRLSLKIKQLQ